MSRRADVLSYGGGRQSIAMCVLVAQGRLPRPERLVIADTGREAQSTWDYLTDAVQPLLASVGLQVEVAPRSLATVDLYGKNGDLLLPVFTATGKLPTLCSNEWKQRVVRRFLAGLGYGQKRPVQMWIGYTTDEAHRMKPSGVQWASNHWPIAFDVPLRRADCAAIIASAGLPEPPIKSACWMCPHRSNEEWRAIRDEAPGEWQAAISLDQQIRDRDQRGGVYLHRSLKPLATAPIDELDDEQAELFECVGGCFT